MNCIVALASTSAMASMVPNPSTSRGVLASQGTGLSVVGIMGARPQAPINALSAAKSERGWHQEPVGISTGAFDAFAADADRKTAHLPAARLRYAHPATVISSRHRSRLR